MIQSSETRARSFPWRTLIVVGAFLVVCAMGLAAIRWMLRAPVDTAGQVAAAVTTVATNLPAIAEKFRTGLITHSFSASLPEIVGTGGDILEVAVLESEETFRRSDSKNVFWNSLYLGTTVSEIRVPVTYRYHVQLSDPWRLATRDRVCLVLGPPIRASQPPAIHTDRMVKSTERGWARFNQGENLAELERSLTPTLKDRAVDARRMRLVREMSRQSVAGFVRRWLMREDHWRTDRFTAIVVVFADEASVETDEELERYSYEPTVQLSP
jgi:hypothetical protein